MRTRVSERRALWLAVSAAALLAAGPGACPEREDEEYDEVEPQRHVRQEIHSLPTDQIDAYRAGVALMKTRPADDPTSWTYQANIHGIPTTDRVCEVTPGDPQPAWVTCQHGNFFFLSWHRMYIYYFERILRAAVAEATGDPEALFSLPYWDYENPAFEALPQPFRVPADDSNPLYVSARARACNAGLTCVSAEEGSASEALSRVPFCNCPSGQSCTGCDAGLTPDEAFGSQFTPVPQHSGGGFGELESQPHNIVHTLVGGPLGWMAWVECAARDPIFWLHHANIDRLWQVWLNQGGRVNPLDAEEWKSERFMFFDENGQAVELTGCDILNMVTQLDYSYDGLPVENVVQCEGPEAEARAAARPATTLASSERDDTALGREPVKVRVPVPEAARETVLELIREPDERRLRVVIEGLRLVHPGAYYQVYLNLPEGTEPDPRGEYFLGNVALFGQVRDDAPTAQRSFDVTDKVSAWHARGEWTGDVELTFVHGNPEPVDPGGPPAPEVFLRFTHVSFIHR